MVRATLLASLLALGGCGDAATFTGKASNGARSAPAAAPASTPPATPKLQAVSEDADAVKSAPVATPTPVPQPKATPVPAPAPVPPAAVTKGSFTAWAQPPNPQPGEDYQIFIKVALPAATKGYLEADLSGTLNGTDHYVQDLGTSAAHGTAADPFGLQTKVPVFTVTGDTAELSIWVPGAAAGVVDTINIHSALLNEAQALTIDFQ